MMTLYRWLDTCTHLSRHGTFGLNFPVVQHVGPGSLGVVHHVCTLVGDEAKPSRPAHNNISTLP